MSWVRGFGVERLSYDVAASFGCLALDCERVLGEIVEPHCVVQIEGPNLVLEAFVFVNDKVPVETFE